MTKDELLSLKINRPDDEIRRLAKARWDTVAKPIDGLGDFEDIICTIAAIQRTITPRLNKKALIIMCADNGVVCEGVSQTGQEVTYDVAALMGERRSSVGIMTAGYPVDIYTYDVGINSANTPKGVIDRKICAGTADFVKECAMTAGQCMDAVNTGIDAVRMCSQNGYGIIATGEMGIGNTTTSTALLCAITGAAVEDVTGRGSGLTEEGMDNKIRVIKKGLDRYTGGVAVSSPAEAFEVLRCMGGLDIAALAGVFTGAALYGIPVVIDGLISAVAALMADTIVPGCRSYMIASHMGKEKGMQQVLDSLSLKPVIHADMALGEGTGAVLILPMLDMVSSLYLNGTTFEMTSIEKYERLGK